MSHVFYIVSTTHLVGKISEIGEICDNMLLLTMCRYNKGHSHPSSGSSLHWPSLRWLPKKKFLLIEDIFDRIVFCTSFLDSIVLWLKTPTQKVSRLIQYKMSLNKYSVKQKMFKRLYLLYLQKLYSLFSD